MLKEVCRTIKNTSLKAIEIARSLNYLVEFVTRSFFPLLRRKCIFTLEIFMRSINFPLNFFFVNLYFSSAEDGQLVIRPFLLHVHYLKYIHHMLKCLCKGL